MAAVCVELAAKPFDPAQRMGAFAAEQAAGAVASFCGAVRASDGDRAIESMRIDHYPGMTEKCMHAIAQKAADKWGLDGALIVHRFGMLAAGEPIVLVAAASAHRKAAFDGCRMMIDYLKTDAPFWKQEIGPGYQAWVASGSADANERQAWEG